MTLSIQVDDRKLQRDLDRVVRKYPAIAKDALLHGLLGLRKDYLKDLAGRLPRMAKGKTAGQLWFARVWPVGRSNFAGKFGGRGKFARDLLLMERGGTIRPTSRRYMAIPGPGARTASGKIRKGFHSPATVKGSIKWAQVRKGDRVLLIERTRRGLGAHLFTLVPSVTIRPQLGLFGFARRASNRAKFVDRIRRSLVKKLKEAQGGK